MKVGVIGITGYTGQELVRILDRHPHFNLIELGARVEKVTPLRNIVPAFRHTQYNVVPVKAPEDIPLAAEAYFLALPHSTAMEYANYLIQKGKIVIDLSADFRFPDTGVYEHHYGHHPFKELNKKAVYGLSEINRNQIKDARLIANPGCYPTSILLGAYPLARRGLITSLIADSKSGLTGAGHNPKPANIYCAVNENFKAYNINRHRHQPEIETMINQFSPEPVEHLVFAPHLVPMNRGIFSTLYITLKQEVTREILREMYLEEYEKEPFIRLIPDSEDVETQAVAYSNFCDLKVISTGWTVIVLSAIDNLGKGAASQAVHNLNIICGIPEPTGLL